jgi:hypothetical protein
MPKAASILQDPCRLRKVGSMSLPHLTRGVRTPLTLGLVEHVGDSDELRACEIVGKRFT